MSTNDSNTALLAATITLGNQLVGIKSSGIGLYAIHVYDYFLTLPQEIEYIWKRKFSFVTALFIMNRYYALGVLSVVIVDLFSPLLSGKVCDRAALFLPFAFGVPLTIIPEIVMGVRVVALYEKNKFVMIGLATYLIAELGTGLWIYSVPGSHPLPLPTNVHGDAFHACTDTTADSLGNLKSAAFLFMSTIYDTVIFVMVAFKVIQARNMLQGKETVFVVMARHSLLYFGVIFSSNLLWALMVVFAPPGLKYSSVYSTVPLVCTVVNRITLDLRSFTSHTGTGNSTSLTPHSPDQMIGTQGRGKIHLVSTGTDYTAFTGTTIGGQLSTVETFELHDMKV